MNNEKICIISLDNINRVPYISFYRKNLSQSFDIIYWNRAGTEETCGAENYYRFECKIYDNSFITTVVSKFMGYVLFRRYVKKILKKNKYAGVIALPSNCSVLLGSVLRKYTNRYIFEVRDYWKEDQKWYYNLEEKIIHNSYFAAISSPSYKEFLPPYDYIQTHNLPEVSDDDLFRIRNRDKNLSKRKIILSCIGGIKHAYYDREILQVVSNDERFEIRYIGRGYEVLKEFVKKIEMKNATIEGLFPQEKTLDYYEDTDVIVNLYGNNTPTLDYALSNKLYYAALFHMPILVCPGTAMAEVSVRNGFGFVFDKDDPDIMNKLYDYCVNIDFSELENNCNLFISEVKNDIETYERKIREFDEYVRKGNMK